MPKLIKLYITHVAIGFGIAAVFVAMLLWFNVANLWHLVSNTEAGMLAVLMLWVSYDIVFAGVQFGIAVMRMKDDDDDDRGGGTRAPVTRRDYATIPVRVDEGRKGLFGGRG